MGMMEEGRVGMIGGGKGGNDGREGRVRPVGVMWRSDVVENDGRSDKWEWGSFMELYECM